MEGAARIDHFSVSPENGARFETSTNSVESTLLCDDHNPRQSRDEPTFAVTDRAEHSVYVYEKAHVVSVCSAHK